MRAVLAVALLCRFLETPSVQAIGVGRHGHYSTSWGVTAPRGVSPARLGYKTAVSSKVVRPTVKSGSPMETVRRIFELTMVFEGQRAAQVEPSTHAYSPSDPGTDAWPSSFLLSSPHCQQWIFPLSRTAQPCQEPTLTERYTPDGAPMEPA